MPNYRRKHSPLLIRRLPWLIIGILIGMALLHFGPMAWQALSNPSAESASPPSAPEHPEIIDMPEAVTAPEVKETPIRDLNELEHEVLLIVNLIRADRGAPLLVWDDELYKYAKGHSEKMAAHGDLFHAPMDTPYGENVWWGAGKDW